jgi:hypothetical protein
VEIVDLVSEGRATTYGDVSDRDVAVVRDARDSLEAILARFGGRSRKRRR